MNKEKIKEISSNFKNNTILVIGDLMVDEYIIGKTERISPEAPVPVVDVEERFFRLGGASNVISNIISLGGSVIPCGVVGDDKDGDFIKSEINKSCELNEIIYDGSRPTTKKTRIFSEHQQMLRVDTESNESIDDYFKNKIFNFIDEYKYSYTGIIISDYQKGLLDHKFLSDIISFGRRYDKKIFVDPKGEYNKYYNSNFMTPNLKELSNMVGYELKNNYDIYNAGMNLYHNLNLDGLIVTRGKDGISIIKNNGSKMITLPTNAKEVYDVSGAGDTVMAAFTLSYQSGLSMEESAELANLAASVVIAKVGTATATLDEILNLI